MELPQNEKLYPRYNNPTMEFYRRKQDVRFVCQVNNFDVWCSTNFTHLYGVWGEGEEQYIPSFIPFSKGSKEEWVQVAIELLKHWRYLHD